MLGQSQQAVMITKAHDETTT